MRQLVALLTLIFLNLTVSAEEFYKCKHNCETPPHCLDLAKLIATKTFPSEADQLEILDVTLISENPHSRPYYLEQFGVMKDKSKPDHWIILTYGFSKTADVPAKCRIEMIDGTHSFTKPKENQKFNRD